MLESPGLKSAGSYMMHMVGPSGHLFDWGDGHAGTPKTGAIFTIADYYNISAWRARTINVSAVVFLPPATRPAWLTLLSHRHLRRRRPLVDGRQGL